VKKFSTGSLFLIVALLFLLVSIPFAVFAQSSEEGSTTEIEIVEDKTTPTPTEVPKSDWKPGADSGVKNPFMDPTDPSATYIQVNAPSPTPPPTPKPTVPPSGTPGAGDPNAVPATVEETPKPTTTTTAPTVPVVSSTPAPSNFTCQGVLWNGYEYVCILVSGDDKSFIARPGKELEGGYVVMYIDDKEIVLLKEGKKETIPIK